MKLKLSVTRTRLNGAIQAAVSASETVLSELKSAWAAAPSGAGVDQGYGVELTAGAANLYYAFLAKDLYGPGGRAGLPSF